MASDTAILQAIEVLSGVFTRWQTNAATIKAWRFALQDLSDKELELGVAAFIRESTSAYGNPNPQPGDIRQAARKSLELTWDKAFQEVMERAHEVLNPVLHQGHYLAVNWSSPLVPQAMNALGGPHYFMRLKSQDLNIARAQFREVWKNMAQQHNGSICYAPMQTQLPAPFVLKEAQSPYRADQALSKPELTPEQQKRAKVLMQQLQASGLNPEEIIQRTARALAHKPQELSNDSSL